MQSPQYPQPPFDSAPRKPKRWRWIVAIIIAFLVGVSVGHSATGSATTTNTTTPTAQVSNSTPIPTTPATPTPTPKPKTWQTTHTFTGNGSKKTETFTVPDDWRLQWKCNPSDNAIGQYNVIVAVKNSDGTDLDPLAVNTICKSGNTSDMTEEHQGGDIYLDVTSESAWTIMVQEFK